MVSQNAIPSKQVLGGSLPFVFTEHGVLQLANVLRSERAVKMSIKIIEVFVGIREMLLSNKEIMLDLEKIRNEVGNNSKDIELIFEYIKQLEKVKQHEIQQENRTPIGCMSSN